MIASYNGYRSFPQKSTRFSDFYSIFWAKIGCFKWFISHAMHIENEFTLSQTVNSSNPYNLRHWFEVQFSTKRSSYAVYVPHHSGFQSMKLHKWNAKTHTKMWRIWIVKKFCYVHRCLHSENCYWWRDKMIFEEKKNCGRQFVNTEHNRKEISLKLHVNIQLQNVMWWIIATKILYDICH